MEVGAKKEALKNICGIQRKPSHWLLFHL